MGNINASGEAETAETSGPPDLGVPAPTEYLVGQTAPYETSDSPEWGRVGGRVGGSLAGTGAGFVPDQTRGVGDFSGQQDALLQVKMPSLILRWSSRSAYHSCVVMSLLRQSVS